MNINGGDKNRVFHHELVKITEGTVSEGTIFMHIQYIRGRSDSSVIFVMLDLNEIAA